MDIHKNARLTVHGRERLVRQVEGGQRPQAVAESTGISLRTVRKWLGRHREEGLAGLADRSSRPRRLYRPTPVATVERIEALRRQRWTGRQISAEVGVSPATVSRVLRRLGLNRLAALDPAPPVRRYQRERPGELIHIDIKKLGRFDKAGHRAWGERREEWRNRGVGWEFVHACPERSRRVCIDDASRVACARVLPDERKESAVAFLDYAVAYYAGLGVRVERVMTDNGSCYRSQAFRDACARLGLRHIRTRPYSPKTNGKAERFIQTALREWAYATVFDTSDHRGTELLHWLHRYNWHRPHAGIDGKIPASKLGLTEDNLLRLHT